ncbi:polysaccharide pyruvyl transferase family protein [Glutamicibacter nicotianae]|uniref:polysaccharide pyruvyl transferase family protein n=1 Tax=Glutamicibacter nicotianae TaxID=37929 RepID=UPI00167F80FD|nr:polysaccharide pyruvyl transferase family protein [Glutamicibacter nicotianae]
MISTIVTLSSVKLEDQNAPRRRMPRPEALRQADYADKYDDDTLFYDVFRDGERIRLSGPPLLNLKDFVSESSFGSDGRTATEVHLQDLDRTQNSWITFDNVAQSVTFDDNSRIHTLDIGESFVDLFENKRALVTKSKDNDLVWIKDWIQFHITVQGVNSVLLYDNMSTSYNSAELLECLRGIKGLDVAVVVEWPFKFGPQGGNWGGVRSAPWDSDFTEYGILEHARHRFLKSADLVISADIDELVMSDNGKDLVSIMDENECSGLVYTGRWMTTAPFGNLSPDTIVRFKDFPFYDPATSLTTQKWAIRPSRCVSAKQWQTHLVPGVNLFRTGEVKHRHFLGINSNWKTMRTNRIVFDASKHLFDEKLVHALIRANLCDESMLDEHNNFVSSQTMLSAGKVDKNELVRQILDLLSGQDGDHGIKYSKPISNSAVETILMKQGYSLRIETRFSDDGASLYLSGTDASSNSWLATIFQCRPTAFVENENAYLILNARLENTVEFVFTRILEQIEWLDHHAKSVNYPTSNRLDVSAAPLPTYWWNGRKNFGDLIGPLLVHGITGRDVINMKDSERDEMTLVTVGSVLNLMERKKYEVWGSGLIAPLHAKSIERLTSHKPAKIHAVRGWKTYKELTEKMGWHVPKVYGDPALLLPRFFTPMSSNKLDVSVIPHYMHAAHFELFTEPYSVLDVMRSAEEVVSDIANSNVVISTSLHGIIVAHAYGIPWTWLRIKNSTLAGDQFKFEDFFSVLDRAKVSEISIDLTELNEETLKFAARKASLPKNKFDFNALLDAFPGEFPGNIQMKKRGYKWLFRNKSVAS